MGKSAKDLYTINADHSECGQLPGDIIRMHEGISLSKPIAKRRRRRRSVISRLVDSTGKFCDVLLDGIFWLYKPFKARPDSQDGSEQGENSAIHLTPEDFSRRLKAMRAKPFEAPQVSASKK